MSMPYRKDTELHHLKFDLKVFIENLAMKLHLIGIKKQIGVEAIWVLLNENVSLELSVQPSNT